MLMDFDKSLLRVSEKCKGTFSSLQLPGSPSVAWPPGPPNSSPRVKNAFEDCGEQLQSQIVSILTPPHSLPVHEN